MICTCFLLSISGRCFFQGNDKKDYKRYSKKVIRFEISSGKEGKIRQSYLLLMVRKKIKLFKESYAAWSAETNIPRACNTLYSAFKFTKLPFKNVTRQSHVNSIRYSSLFFFLQTKRYLFFCKL